MTQYRLKLDDLINGVKSRHPNGSALDHLAEAASIADHLGDLADHLVGHFVDQARRGGASWTAIGQSMGVTKQAAQKRFVAGDSSLDQFTDRAKVVVLRARNEARNRGHAEVDSLHLVLGLLAEWQGLAGKAIEAAGISKRNVSDAVAAQLGPAQAPIAFEVPFSSGLKKVHELIIREALRLGHNYIGTEHILLGLLEAREEPGAMVLHELGLTKAGVEEWTLETLNQLKRAHPGVG